MSWPGSRAEARDKLTLSAVQLLAYVSFYILSAKVRSRALLFLYKLFFQLVYHVFYRNLVRSAAPRPHVSRNVKLTRTVCPPPLPEPVRDRPTPLDYISHHRFPSANVQDVVPPLADLYGLSVPV